MARTAADLNLSVLKRLDDDGLEKLLARAEAAIGHPLPVNDEARATLRAMANNQFVSATATGTSYLTATAGTAGGSSTRPVLLRLLLRGAFGSKRAPAFLDS